MPLEHCAGPDLGELRAIGDRPLGFVVVIEHDNLFGHLDKSWKPCAVGPADKLLFPALILRRSEAVGHPIFEGVELW